MYIRGLLYTKDKVSKCANLAPPLMVITSAVFLCSLASPWLSVLIRLDSLYSTRHFGFYVVRCLKQPSAYAPLPQGTYIVVRHTYRTANIDTLLWNTKVQHLSYLELSYSFRRSLIERGCTKINLAQPLQVYLSLELRD